MLHPLTKILIKQTSKQEDNKKTKVIAIQGSHQVYNTIPKSREWMIENCIDNVTKTTLPRFYMFKKKDT